MTAHHHHHLIKHTSAVGGVFDSIPQAESAVHELADSGVSKQHVTVFASEATMKSHFPEFESVVQPEDWKIGAMLGSVTGATVGGLAAAVAIATGAGLPLIAAGGMAGLLTGGVAGGLAGAMGERGLEPDAADFYQQAVAAGDILVVVDTSAASEPAAEQKKIGALFEQAGGEVVPLNDE